MKRLFYVAVAAFTLTVVALYANSAEVSLGDQQVARIIEKVYVQYENATEEELEELEELEEEIGECMESDSPVVCLEVLLIASQISEVTTEKEDLPSDEELEDSCSDDGVSL